MNKLRLNVIIALVSTLCLSLISLSAKAQQVKPWTVPDEFINMENPVAKSDTSIKAGMTLYVKYGASCHGKTGMGDGVKSRTLKGYAGDFSGEYYQNQTDGEHFYKTKFGRGEMPKYEGKISDENIWNIVNYMRTFNK
jgi:mono/diheme cytochrome c family protein